MTSCEICSDFASLKRAYLSQVYARIPEELRKERNKISNDRIKQKYLSDPDFKQRRLSYGKEYYAKKKSAKIANAANAENKTSAPGIEPGLA